MAAQELMAVNDRITALSPDEVKTPSMPIQTCVQEGENLFKWGTHDRDYLIAAGLSPDTLDSLPLFAGALREAEANWYSERFTKEESQRLWAIESKKGFELQSELFHIAFFALRNIPDLQRRVSAMNDNMRQDNLMQNLNTFAVIGREHPEPFIAAGVDMSIFATAQQMADRLAEILADANAEENSSGKKDIRDRAYTLLKNAMTEVRTVGQYVFWKDKERLHGYHSDYVRRLNTKKSPQNEPPIAN